MIGRRDRIKHDDKGNASYGMDMFVSKEYRDLRLGRRLYYAGKELCRNFNLRAILAGGRIIHYHEHAEMEPANYIEAVRRREIHDPILSFQLSKFCALQGILTPRPSHFHMPVVPLTVSADYW